MCAARRQWGGGLAPGRTAHSRWWSAALRLVAERAPPGEKTSVRRPGRPDPKMPSEAGTPLTPPQLTRRRRWRLPASLPESK
jgi:hypothetical protein